VTKTTGARRASRRWRLAKILGKEDSLSCLEGGDGRERDARDEDEPHYAEHRPEEDHRPQKGETPLLN
jgi:hypothetical protein